MASYHIEENMYFDTTSIDNNDDVVMVGVIREKIACNGLACETKRTHNIWYANFDDIKETIGLNNIVDFNSSKKISDIQNALIEQRSLYEAEHKWVTSLVKVVKKYAFKKERL